jgi:hypothetical protein
MAQEGYHMSLQKGDADWEWRPPPLDSESQVRFWNRMASTYEGADMTHNTGEQRAVERLTDEFVVRGYQAEDVVTLGGAVGCRDPRIVVERLRAAGQTPGRIFFNDLAPALVAHASEHALAPYRESGMDVRTFSGKVADASAHVPKMPRRVLIGVYGTQAFLRAHPEEGHLQDGFTEYLANDADIGTRLWLECFRLSSGAYAPAMQERFLTGRAVGTSPDVVRSSLGKVLQEPHFSGVGALRIIGSTNDDRDGYFLSHWFTNQGIRSLIEESFVGRAVKMRVFPCGKGMLVCLDPLYERPRGILTVLNNVVGNILPDEQLRSLRVIHRLTY